MPAVIVARPGPDRCHETGPDHRSEKHSENELSPAGTHHATQQLGCLSGPGTPPSRGPGFCCAESSFHAKPFT